MPRDFGGRESTPFVLKDAVVIARGAALVISGLKILGEKGSDAETEGEGADEASSELPQSTIMLSAAPPTPAPRSLSPGGWYQDGRSELLRWWDGDTWTDHFQPTAKRAAAVTPAVPAGWYHDGQGRNRWWGRPQLDSAGPVMRCTRRVVAQSIACTDVGCSSS